MKQKNNDWNVPESYFLESKSRLLHHTEWQVEDAYFAKNKAALLRKHTWKINKSWYYLAAAACTIGVAFYLGLHSTNELHPNATPLAAVSQPAKTDTSVNAPAPVTNTQKQTSKSVHRSTHQPVQPHNEVESSVPSANFEQALASISKEEIIDYLAEESDEMWYDTNTN